VPLTPDDFLYLALGATPVIAGAHGGLRWDAKKGREVLELEGDGGMSQKVELDGRHGKDKWDVVHSEVKGSDGKLIWKVDHFDYKELTGSDGKMHRVPGKSNVVTPAEKTDLGIQWGSEREINLELAPESWQLEAPPVPMCGTKAK
jgi:hypothetical protein